MEYVSQVKVSKSRDKKLMQYKHEILEYILTNYKYLDEIYTWNFKSLPEGLSPITANNPAHKNILLRQALHNELKMCSNSRRCMLIEWYIRDWGGIKSNKKATLEKYSSKNPPELITQGINGIASWSKALSIIDPAKYAIFDARVAFSLNAIQEIKKVEFPYFFPNLPSRNSKIKAINKSSWENSEQCKFYNNYLDILKEVENKVKEDFAMQKAEMLLFAKAEELAGELKKSRGVSPLSQ